LKFSLPRGFEVILTLLSVSLLTFLLFQVAGGDPASRLAGLRATESNIETLRQELGTDQPLVQQYLVYTKNLLKLDFGKSWVQQKSVASIMRNGIGPTLCLLLPAFGLSVLFSFLLALFGSFRRGKRWDSGLLLGTYGLMSFSFLIFILFFQYVFSYRLGLFPIAGWSPDLVDRWAYLALPIFIYAIVLTPSNYLIFRAVVLEEEGQGYARAARAKGLSETQVAIYHLMKNASLTVVTVITTQLPGLFLGSLLLESFFSIPGLGGSLYSAFTDSDLPVIQGLTLLSSIIYILLHWAGDELQRILDPREGRP